MKAGPVFKSTDICTNIYIYITVYYIYITQTADSTELFRPLWTHQCSTKHETGPGGNEEEQQFRQGRR